jgi:hypothetical protein
MTAITLCHEPQASAVFIRARNSRIRKYTFSTIMEKLINIIIKTESVV